MRAVKFQFDDGPAWSGFAHESTWNGFDNVAVTLETRDYVAQWLESLGDSEGAADVRALEEWKEGLVSFSFGYATSIVADGRRLTWLDIAKLPASGTRVRFAESWDIFPETIIPQGATATISENGLNEIWCALLVMPDDSGLRADLKEWNGAIHFHTYHTGLDPSADNVEIDSAWNQLSPLELLQQEATS